jgi:hypothetical protein
MRRRLLAAAVAVLATALAIPAGAAASSTQQTVLQDDDQLIYATPRHMAETLRQLAALGVDRVKVSVVWALVAPQTYSKHRPKFDAANPASYPPGAWDRYDMLVRMAHELGMGVYFQFAPPDPAWAVPRGESTHQGPALGHAPASKLFSQFVEAVGRRYSGTYEAPVPATQPSPAVLGIHGDAASKLGLTAAIPRVDWWGIWNEPNERSWLNPWRRPVRGHPAATIGAALYRRLFDAAWRGLAASEHVPGRDAILIGETANVGVLAPAPFIRALYCVGSNYRPLRGVAASELGCPRSGSRRHFVAGNPGLFKASGFAHHPYGFDVAPNRRYPLHYFITLENIGSLERLLHRTLAGYGRHRSLPVYVSEWGYKTRPPNPFFKTTLSEQQTWLDEGAYLAFKRPFVRSVAQFLLVDDKPKAGTPKGSGAYWSTFQTGLEFSNGAPKPALGSFRLPIWLPSAGHGHVAVWGQLRGASRTSQRVVTIQYERSGSSSWSDVKAVQVTNQEGFLSAHLSLPAGGSLRLSWTDPVTHATDVSRSATVH